MQRGAHIFIAHQQMQLETWSQQGEQIGIQIANEVWDRLEVELEEMTRDGLVWDLAAGLRSAMSSTLLVEFDDVCEKWIMAPLQAMAEELRGQLGDEMEQFDTASMGLDHLRKGLRLHSHLNEHLAALFDQAKPGVFTLLWRAVSSNDAERSLENFEAEGQADAQRLRQTFYEAREQFVPDIAATATRLLQRAVTAYTQALSKEHVNGALQASAKPLCITPD